MDGFAQSWRKFQPTKENAFWFGVVCVAATVALGFGPAGWVTGGTAQKMADEAAATSRNQLASAVCADAFLRAADSRARLAKLKQLEWYERDDAVTKAGFAKMPGEEEANGEVAELCASRLVERADAARRTAPAAATLAGG
jgi:hypothetical protein